MRGADDRPGPASVSMAVVVPATAHRNSRRCCNRRDRLSECGSPSPATAIDEIEPPGGAVQNHWRRQTRAAHPTAADGLVTTACAGDVVVGLIDWLGNAISAAAHHWLGPPRRFSRTLPV